MFQKNDSSKADYLNKTKAYGKAACYHLLSKELKKAVKSAKKAVKLGEKYAYDHMREAYLSA